MKYISFIFFVIFCSCVQKENNSIIFYQDFPDQKLWKGNKNIDIEEMKNIEKRWEYTRCSFDSVTGKIWAWNIADEKDYFYLADVTNGKYTSEKEIFFNIPYELEPQFVFPFNGFALIEYRWGFYGIADLNNVQQELLDLRDILDKKKASGTMGFDFENIFFVNGFYSIASAEFYKYEIPIKLPRIINSEHKVIGLDNDNFIVIYDYINKHFDKTNITMHERFPMLDYRPNDMYFLYKEKLFFSTDVINFINILAFLRMPAYRKWYMYDLESIEKTRISSPSGYAQIIGYWYPDSVP